MKDIWISAATLERFRRAATDAEFADTGITPHDGGYLMTFDNKTVALLDRYKLLDESYDQVINRLLDFFGRL